MIVKVINSSVSDETTLAYQWHNTHKEVCLLIMSQASGCQGAPLGRYPSNDSGYRLFSHMYSPSHDLFRVLNWTHSTLWTNMQEQLMEKYIGRLQPRLESDQKPIQWQENQRI